ncbi:MAG TPA: GNAT family N-acetyltransferase [Bacillales bacterium]|nr:GNAT family N-acetyltransferase [Bacillales bacterium]
MFVLNIAQDLTLKQLEYGEASELFNLIQSCRSYLRHWLKWIDTLRTAQDVEHFIHRASMETMNGRSLQAGIRSRGELAGLISYDFMDWENRSTNIGAWLGDHFQGKGIISRATWAMTEYAFQQMKLNRVEIRCGLHNAKSRAVPERLGFREEGVVHEAEWLHHRFIDHVIYGMTKKDYLALTGQP